MQQCNSMKKEVERHHRSPENISKQLNASRRSSCDVERAPRDELKPSDASYMGMQDLSEWGVFNVGPSVSPGKLLQRHSAANRHSEAFQNHTAKCDPTVNTPQSHWLSFSPSGLRLFLFLLVMAVWKSDGYILIQSHELSEDFSCSGCRFGWVLTFSDVSGVC